MIVNTAESQRIVPRVMQSGFKPHKNRDAKAASTSREYFIHQAQDHTGANPDEREPIRWRSSGWPAGRQAGYKKYF